MSRALRRVTSTNQRNTTPDVDWRWTMNNDDTGDLVTSSWADVAYDDSSWNGPSSAPFSTSNINALSLLNAITRYTAGSYAFFTFYYRTTFNMPFPIECYAAAGAGSVSVRYDDAFEVYLNGVLLGGSANAAGELTLCLRRMPYRRATVAACSSSPFLTHVARRSPRAAVVGWQWSSDGVHS